MTVFVGELNNQPVVVAHSLSTPNQNMLTTAMLEVAQPKRRLPIFNAAGWAIQAASPELTPSEVADTVTQMAPKETVQLLEEDEATLLSEMEKFLGSELIEQAFTPVVCRVAAIAGPDALHAR